VWAFRSFSHERDLSRRLERFSLEMAAGMITALDLKDNYTAQHSAAVAQYSFDIARAMKLSSRECNLAHLAGLLHDLGKISVPDDVLNCPTKLDADQWDLVQGHSVAGQKILGNMNEFKELATIVLYHHERYDGGGYPDRVSGEGIPLLSRIVSVADSYSAMISDRPYRARLPWETAKREIIEKSGQQFDPMVAGRFIEVLETHDDHYRRADQVDFHVQFQKVRFLRDLKWSSEQP
jgi:putative nucleotidyltransferase with HDIG domain